MIDFNSNSVFVLRKDKVLDYELVKDIIISGEQILQTYTTVRDKVIFTNKRVISVNVQGITGKKKDFSTLPYSKIQVFSVETAGNFDLDSELEMYFSGLGKVKFEFSGNSDIVKIGQLISGYILK